MTTQKHDQPEEEAFDDFLQGRGELVKQLKALSQLTPSAALDAAILASAKAAVAQAERSQQAAANDPVSPGKPGLLSRFRMPLALAASLMVAVLVTVQWHVQSEYQLPLQTAQAPAAESAAATATPTPAVEAPQPAQSGLNAKATSEPTNNNVAAAGQSKPAISATASKAHTSEEKAATQIAANGTSKPTAEHGNAAPAQLAQADAAQMKYKSAAIQEQRAATPPIATTLARESARVAAAPAPASAPVAVAPPAESLAKADSQEKQKAWLMRIEELIKTDSRKDALIEWEKFEKAYPGYPVPEKLREQIKALKN